MSEEIIQSLVQYIEKSKKEITVLFTDIVQSTRYWDQHGDTAGRLMVDRHNRLLFPVVKHFGGRVTKTIGDSIMATFKSPVDGVLAAIGMQQMLSQERKRDKTFDIHVRIGLHTGKAILEKEDVFGDVVNVASRVESSGGRDELLLSANTLQAVRQANNHWPARLFKKRSSFIPKGKKRPLSLYACRWQKHDDLIDRIRVRPLIPVGNRQKWALVKYVGVTMVAVWWLYVAYLKYLLSDVEFIATTILDPHPLVGLGMGLAGLGALVLFWAKVIVRLQVIGPRVFKALKGGYGFGLAFLGFLVFAHWVLPAMGPYWNASVYSSHHLFVEVLSEETHIKSDPSLGASTLAHQLSPGSLYLQSRLVHKGGLVWTKVLLNRSDHRYGYILRQTPARMGIAPKRLTRSDKFTIRFVDIYALLAGFLGLLWGFLSFRIQPL